jgi:DNA-binding LytR/AlgR family response regulator
MKCIIVDDEPLAQDLLEDFIGRVTFLQLRKRCRNVMDAMKILQKESIDLIFLDIQMPKITGIQFAGSIAKAPMIIFTTAFSKYAVESYNLDAVDYLLKPFSFERFLKAVNKAYSIYAGKDKRAIEAEDSGLAGEFIFVNAEYSSVKINLNDILYIEGLKDYVKIYAGAKPLLTLQSLKSLEGKLPGKHFIRVHRSYIVSIDKIDSIQRNRIVIGDKYIPIGETYKDEFYERIGKHNV